MAVASSEPASNCLPWRSTAMDRTPPPRFATTSACCVPSSDQHRKVWSSPPVNTRRPSGVTATAWTAPAWPFRMIGSVDSFASVCGRVQRRAVPSDDAEAKCFPLGKNARLSTAPVCPASVASSFPSSRANRRICPSDPPAETFFPSGEIAKLCTEADGWGIFRSSFPVDVDQMRMVLSAPAEIRVCPSAETASASTAAVWPWNVLASPPLGASHSVTS